MSQKKIKSFNGLVFSTDPDFKLKAEETNSGMALPLTKQQLRISLDKKHRAGKPVTLIIGFMGKDVDLQELGRQLKLHCGTGGSVKDSNIIVQGDNREKVLQWLHKNGYSSAKQI